MKIELKTTSKTYSLQDYERKGALEKEVAELTAIQAPPKPEGYPRREPHKPLEPMTYDEYETWYNEEHLPYCRKTQKVPEPKQKESEFNEEYKELRQRYELALAKTDYKIKLEKFNNYQSSDEVKKYIQYEEKTKSLSAKQKKLTDLNKPISYEQVILEAEDIDKDGALQERAKKSLQTLGLSKTAIDDLEKTSVLLNKLKKICQESQSNPYFLDSEKKFTKECLDILESHNKSTHAVFLEFECKVKNTPKSTMSEQFIQFFKEIWISVMIFCFADDKEERDFKKTKDIADSARKIGFFDVQDDKEKVKSLRSEIAAKAKAKELADAVPKAEKLFISEFEKAIELQESLNKALQSRQIFTKGNKQCTLDDLASKFFDKNGKIIKQQEDNGLKMNLGRARDRLSKMGFENESLTDLEAIAIDSLIFETSAKVSEHFSGLLFSAMGSATPLYGEKGEPPDEVVDQIIQTIMANHQFITQVHENSQDVKKYLKENSSLIIGQVRSLLANPLQNTPHPG